MLELYLEALRTYSQLVEAQFDIVVREEKAQTLEAFEKLSTVNRGHRPYRPLVVIIICGKRHNAKYNFFISLYLPEEAQHSTIEYSIPR